MEEGLWGRLDERRKKEVRRREGGLWGKWVGACRVLGSEGLGVCGASLLRREWGGEARARALDS